MTSARRQRIEYLLDKWDRAKEALERFPQGPEKVFVAEEWDWERELDEAEAALDMLPLEEIIDVLNERLERMWR